MPLIDVTYGPTVREEALGSLAELLPGTRFRKKSSLDAGDLDAVIEVRAKLFEARVQDKQQRADLIRDRLPGVALGQVGVRLILSEDARGQTESPVRRAHDDPRTSHAPSQP